MFELDFDGVLGRVPDRAIYRGISRYPATERHLSIVASAGTAYSTLERIVINSGGEMVESVALLDVYSGEQLADNARSITLSIVFRSKEKTLTDEEVNGVLARIRESLVLEAGVSFR